MPHLQGDYEKEQAMNKKDKKELNKMFDGLATRMGSEHGAAMMVAILCDLLDEFTKDVEERELRTMELTLNGFFTSKFDFVKMEVIR